MNPESVLLRQVHPDFIPDGKLTSQAFYPFPKDDGKLSAYDGDQISAAAAFEHYTTKIGFESRGVWGVDCKEVNEVGLECQPDPLPESPAHALIDFGKSTEKECRKLAKRLKAFALARGCLHASL
ncbi:hypothetical protein AB7849_03165 [Rhodanobacter sp. 115]|jgi:hypothetical protein|uniref:hypothetical protein n=1 Tax=Rhodanobacter sp. FW021-MT20 TaxID=1162282 RepID=UPI00178C526A|nr:hypothetical protein [Rhodanobacter sp. 115]